VIFASNSTGIRYNYITTDVFPKMPTQPPWYPLFVWYLYSYFQVLFFEQEMVYKWERLCERTWFLNDKMVCKSTPPTSPKYTFMCSNNRCNVDTIWWCLCNVCSKHMERTYKRSAWLSLLDMCVVALGHTN
jgi:hypothetical protein